MALSCFTAAGCAYHPGGRKSHVENYQSSHEPTEDGCRAAATEVADALPYLT